jgi:RHS repeat-associated protein
MLAMWGSLAAANVYRFSSKEWNGNSGLYYYLYRFYDPNLQRWLDRDPIEESGGMNLYELCKDNPICYVDLYGKQLVIIIPPNLPTQPTSPSSPTPVPCDNGPCSLDKLQKMWDDSLAKIAKTIAPGGVGKGIVCTWALRLCKDACTGKYGSAAMSGNEDDEGDNPACLKKCNQNCYKSALSCAGVKLPPVKTPATPGDDPQTPPTFPP